MSIISLIRNFRFDASFDDIEPANKNPEHLAYCILMHASGELNYIKTYTHNEQKEMARLLIAEGCIQGGFNGDDVGWSKIKPLGRVILDDLKLILELK